MPLWFVRPASLFIIMLKYKIALNMDTVSDLYLRCDELCFALVIRPARVSGPQIQESFRMRQNVEVSRFKPLFR